MTDAYDQQTWDALCDALKVSGKHLARCDDPATRMDLIHSFTMTHNPVYAATMSDPDYPEFVPVCNNTIPIACANPDYNYTFTSVDCEGTYRLTGSRGTTLFVGIQCCRDYSIFTNRPGPTFTEFMLDDLTLTEDGNFDVLLSKQRPDGWTGDWWEMPDTTDYLFLRDCSCDWAKERGADIAIDRIDIPARRKRRSAQELERRVARLYQTHHLQHDLWLQIIEGQRQAGAVNTLKFIQFEQWGGVPDQVYYDGTFELSPDEALIVETAIPDEVLYWAIQLSDDVYMCMDAQHRQSSLNQAQAQLDSDGKFRAVLSWADPGVPNWLDCQGYDRGGITGRWNKANIAILPDTKVVPLSQVRAHLPADTPHVSLEEREAILRERRRGYQMRRRW